MPKLNECPEPKKRFHGKRWRIYWTWNWKQYSIATSHLDSKKTFGIDADLRLVSGALAMPMPVFPEQYQGAPAVIAYLEDRYGSAKDDAPPPEPEKWLDEYRHEIQGKNTPGWVSDSIAMLEKLRTACGALEAIDEKAAAAYMADIATKRTAGTHNRTLTVFKKFYSWLVDTIRHTSNPFAKIKRMKEPKEESIVYCTRAERDELIVLALGTGWPEWTAVCIAFFTGMRREEIANLRWEDIRFDTGVIVIKKTKTKESRIVPLNSVLEEFLLGEDDRTGYVVKTREGEDRVGRLYSLANRIRKDKKAAMARASGIVKPPPSKAKEFKAKWKAYQAAVAGREREIETALERIGWNAWRHTFASLLVQDGVELDAISAWMGNTPEVCRRHYAAFIPRDRRDARIDRL